MSSENTFAAGEAFNHQDIWQAWDEQAWADFSMTLPPWDPLNQADHYPGLQEQMVTLTSPTQSPRCLNSNIDSNKPSSHNEITMFPSAPIISPPAVPTCRPSKKRKHCDIEDGDVQSKEPVHDGPRCIEELSGPSQHKLQELIEAARDEMVQLQQEVKRLGARVLMLEQGKECQRQGSQERLLAKVPVTAEEAKDVPAFKRGWVAALQSLNR